MSALLKKGNGCHEAEVAILEATQQCVSLAADGLQNRTPHMSAVEHAKAGLHIYEGPCDSQLKDAASHEYASIALGKAGLF
jgi:hypothetical protein